jgi:dTDP-4-amino-4,6-dideoxygalactose transaminase
VSFLVGDRRDATAFFVARGIDLGEWFDGPLSPLPTSPLFNYQVARYPKAAGVAQHVVNVPCHNRMTEGDVAHVAEVLAAFVRERLGSAVHHLH